MKSTETFKQIIQDKLNEVAKEDSLFAKNLYKENKNIDDCITYIFNQVQKSGCNGFADDEIFNMAIHYYDEDEIEVGSKINADVIVNRSIPAAAPKEKKKAVEKKVQPIEQTEQIKFIQGSLF